MTFFKWRYKFLLLLINGGQEHPHFLLKHEAGLTGGGCRAWGDHRVHAPPGGNGRFLCDWLWLVLTWSARAFICSHSAHWPPPPPAPCLPFPHPPIVQLTAPIGRQYNVLLYELEVCGLYLYTCRRMKHWFLVLKMFMSAMPIFVRFNFIVQSILGRAFLMNEHVPVSMSN